MKSKSYIVSTWFLLGCIVCYSSFAQGIPQSPQNIDEIKQAVSQIINEYDIPAVGIAMVDENGPIWIGSLGKANLEKDIDANEHTLYRIASTSKVFIALSALKLIQEGKLSLNDKLADLAPEIEFSNEWESEYPIRIVHLLEQTTGWDEIHYPEFGHNDPSPITLKQGLEYHPHSRRSRWIPGTRYAYTNSAPAVAAYVVEKISKQRFEDFVQENFFAPIGMTSATYYMSDDYLKRGATLYMDNKPLKYSHMIMRPSGAINASVLDMASMLHFFISRGTLNGTEIIPDSLLRRMERVESTLSAQAGQQTGYGLNNYTSRHNQWVYREHNGGIDGALTEFAYLPEAKLGHAIMLNTKNVAALKKLSTLIRDYETRNLPSKIVENEQKVLDQLLDIVGMYYPINPRVQKFAFLERFLNMKVFTFDGHTLKQQGPLGGRGQKFYPVSKNLYKSQETGSISLAVVTDPLSGEVIHVAEQSGHRSLVLKRTSFWLGYLSFLVAFLWGITTLISFIYYPILGVRTLIGKARNTIQPKRHWWPFLPSISILLTLALLRVASTDAYRYMASPTIVSVGVTITTIAFALFSSAAVFYVFKLRSKSTKYTVTLLCLHFGVTVYLLFFGVIGIRFWA